MSKLTQRELAAHLGLSYATVSRVFNGDERVTEPTRRRVLQEAERLGFRGHALARALRLKKSFALGMVGTNSHQGYWSNVVAAMERRARELGYHVIICHRGRDEGSAEQIRFLLDRQVDALVLAPHPTAEEPAVLREITEEGTPLLMLNNRLSGFPAHYLGTDSRTGMRRACEHLLALGHRRIACAAGPAGEYTAMSRVAGYREALRSAEVAYVEQWVVSAGWNQPDGEAAGRRLLALSPRPTAVVAANDDVAIGIYLEARKAGLRIPEDLSIVGYSGDRTGALLATPLTTVRQPVDALGRRATELMLELMGGVHERLVCEELEDELVIRESCSKPVD
jgi:LacI family transcriptional regulator